MNNNIDFGPRPLPDPRPRAEIDGWRYMLIPLILLAFLGGLFIGAKIQRDNPLPPDETDGYVNVEDHEGEILVVRDDGALEWTTEAELHARAGHT